MSKGTVKKGSNEETEIINSIAEELNAVNDHSVTPKMLQDSLIKKGVYITLRESESILEYERLEDSY